MTEPRRIQRKRTKGWRMPEGAVYVGRGSRWGNPWRVGQADVWTVLPGGLIDKSPHGPLTREQAVESYRNSEEAWAATCEADWYADLRGRDLACWCPLDQPCHAEVLLELANGDA